MKTTFTPTLLLLSLFSFLFAIKGTAQSCSNISINYTSSESRCISTGSITITATGGSGDYNYKVEGPVTKAFTSSNIITGLEPGTYKITVKDLTQNCETSLNNAVVAGSYQNPSFQLLKTDVSCLNNDGTISIDNMQYGRSPFSYTIIAPSPSGVGTTITSGSFSNLTPGEYAIQLRDSCGGIQVRRVTIENYSWWFDNVALTKTDCNNANAIITLKNNKGAYNTSGSSFAGFTYGVVNSPADTTWMSGYNFNFFIGTKRFGTLVAKDDCGTVVSHTWTAPSSSIPSVASSVSISSKTCTTFIPTVTGQQNLTSPVYTLYESSNSSAILQTNNNGIFTAIGYGSYCINIRDNCYDTTISRCFTQARPVPSVGASIGISNRTCTTFTASVSGQTNLSSPQYCLHNAADVELECNSSGIFNLLAYGTYSIKIKNGCLDTTIIRTFTASRLLPTITNVTTSAATCTTSTATANGGNNLIAPIEYCLYDNNGNKITCNSTGIFPGINHGNYCMQAVTACNDSSNTVCFTSSAPKPAVNTNVQITEACTSFTATITGKTNLVLPSYYLTNANGDTIDTNTSGDFAGLTYGSYCIKIKDGCYDTTIIRCFNAIRTKPSINASIAQSASLCSTFTATVTGSHLSNPTYYLFNAANDTIAFNNTGVFPNLSYGYYCAEIEDGCIDTTMRVCGTFSLNSTISVTASKTCTFDSTNLQVSFASINAPYLITIYHPSGALVHTANTSSISSLIKLPGLPVGLKYKVKGTDNCGNADSVLVTPEATTITRTINVISKCPSSTWLNGSGNMSVTCSSNLYSVTPSIIKKDGATFNLNYSSNTGNNFVFSDIGPGIYIVQYTMQNCSSYQYDTVTVKPYSFPDQNKSAVYQCNDGSFTLSADVTGGVSPYEYEIIGSQPSTPSIISAKQSSAVFTINNGTTYSLIRLRTIDACGNAALNDVSVLPLQNIAIQINSTCLFNNITLSVDTITNASYSWYKKRTATDSSLLSNDLTYNIPFMEQDDIGTYVCVASVNNNCLTRISYFELTGDCGHVTLASPVILKGKKMPAGNYLSWESKSVPLNEFVIERKEFATGRFVVAGKVKAETGTNYYSFLDIQADDRTIQYRLRIIGKQNAYSNIISLSSKEIKIGIYPNPVKDRFYINLGATKEAVYDVLLINATGQVIYSDLWKRDQQSQYTYKRNSTVKAGVYVVKLINKTDGTTTVHKLLFE